MKCKAVFRHVLRHVCSSLGTHFRVFCRWGKVRPLLPGRTDRLWQSLLLKGRHTKTDMRTRTHTHTHRHALTFHNHTLLRKAPPRVCLSPLYILWSASLANWHVLSVVIWNDKQTCKRVIGFFFLFVSFFFKWKKSVMGGACLMWVYQCESLLVMWESDSDTPVVQLAASFFHSAAPRRQRGGFPLECQLRATGSSRSSLWPYYFHLLNTIRLPMQGGKEEKETKDHVVFVLLTLKQKFVFPHMPHCGVCYGVTTGRGHNLYWNNIKSSMLLLLHLILCSIFKKANYY